MWPNLYVSPFGAVMSDIDIQQYLITEEPYYEAQSQFIEARM